MDKRAGDIAQTRQRIVDAAVLLHGTIGPAATTISALAAKAGVTRLTVYRHFPDDGALIAACSQHWASGQVLPDPESWRRIGDAEQRLRVGLSDLYRFYRDGEAMLTNVRRDEATLPMEVLERTRATESRYRDTLMAPFSVRTARRKRLTAVVSHSVSFWTWRSLCLDHRLTNLEAVEAMTALVLATRGQDSSPRPDTRGAAMSAAT